MPDTVSFVMDYVEFRVNYNVLRALSRGCRGPTPARVHIRGSVTLSSGTTTSAPGLFILPRDERPARIVAFPIATGQSAGVNQGGTALLLIYPGSFGGFVGLFSASNPADPVIHVGDIAFRTDA